jgi:hypothetical protein
MHALIFSQIFLFPFTGHENTASLESGHKNTFCFFVLETFHHTYGTLRWHVDLILPRPVVRVIPMGRSTAPLAQR